MVTKITQNTNIDKVIELAIKPYLHQSDYEIRVNLSGCGLMAALFARQHFEVGTEEYNYLCINLSNKLSEMLQRAYKNTQKFKVVVEYKSKSKPNIFGYECTAEERTEAEAMQRTKERIFKDLHTNRIIKPIFTNFQITKN